MDDFRVNKRAMQAFKKEVEGVLTGQEVKVLREELGLHQADVARMLGVALSHSQNMSREYTTQLTSFLLRKGVL